MSHEIEIWIKKIITLILMIVVMYIGYATREILFLLLISWFLTLLITPLVNKWKKYHIPEWLTITIVYIGIIILATIVIVTIIPIIINYFSWVVKQIADWAITAQDIYSKHGIKWFNLPPFIEDIINYSFHKENLIEIFSFIKQNAWSIQTFLTSQLSSITSWSISIISSIGWWIASWLMIGVMTFFMTLERQSIGQTFLNLTPDRLETTIIRIFEKIQNVCIAWIRATAILGFSIFLCTYIGLYIVEFFFHFKTESNFTLALISGIMEFIPYIGPILSLIPAIIIGLWIWWQAAFILLILYVIIQQTENNILVPYIMSRNLDISPLFVFIVMLFGFSVWGILWIILAVPIAWIIKVIYIDYLERNNKITKIPHQESTPNLSPNSVKITLKKIYNKGKNMIKK